MSSKIGQIFLRYSEALLPSIAIDYAVYFGFLALLHERFTSFVIGRFVGFMCFYLIAAYRSKDRNRRSFLAFFSIFLANIAACTVLDSMNTITSNALAYKVILDIALFAFNVLFFAGMYRHPRTS